MALSELHNNYNKTCCSNVHKLIIVNMAIKDFNPALILQEIQKLNETCNENKRPKLYVISKNCQSGGDFDHDGLVHQFGVDGVIKKPLNDAQIQQICEQFDIDSEKGGIRQ